MIKNVIFDVGKVLIEYEPLEYIISLGFSQKRAQELLNIIFNNKIWVELDRGTAILAKIMNVIVAENPNDKEDILKVLDEDYAWFKIMVPKPESVNLVYKLKEMGYNLYILSNFSETGFMYVYNRYDFFKVFDGKVVSYQCFKVKPEPEIYEHLINKFGFDPKESVFIDDIPANLKAAEAFGIKTVLFTEFNEVKEKLFKLLEI